MKKYKVKSREEFVGHVFGSEDFLKYWPELLTTGVDILPRGGLYYIVNDGRPADGQPFALSTSFFDATEMSCLEEVQS